MKVEHENNDELSRVSTMTSQKSTSGMASSAFGNDRSSAIQHHFCACRRLSLYSPHFVHFIRDINLPTLQVTCITTFFLVQLASNEFEDLLNTQFGVFGCLCDTLPDFSVLGLTEYTLVDSLLLLLFCAVLSQELQVVGP